MAPCSRGISIGRRNPIDWHVHRAAFHKRIYYWRPVEKFFAGAPPPSGSANNFSTRLDEPVRYALSVAIPIPDPHVRIIRSETQLQRQPRFKCKTKFHVITKQIEDNLSKLQPPSSRLMSRSTRGVLRRLVARMWLEESINSRVPRATVHSK